MCGIVGFVGLEDAALVGKMAGLITHRGPDQSGFFVDKNVSLGHRRLSIIDLSERGKQPMSNEDGTVFVVFNGEIYNFKEVRAELERKNHRFKSGSDTEVIVHAYEEYGDSFVEKLSGDFAFCLWDGVKKKALLARDRLGVKPLYYAVVDGVLVFASEIKALLVFPGLKRALDRTALDEYLSFRYALGPNTLFEGIRKVQPCEILSFHDGKTSRRRYWRPVFAEENLGEGYCVAEIRSRMQASVERRLMSDVPLGAYLSGGLDSSFVVALMAQAGDKPVKTFSVGFGQETDETRYARVVAERFGTDHTELNVDVSNASVLPAVTWHLDEPAADIAAVPTYLMAKETKKHVTVVLTGDGGDEVFGGYLRYSRLGFAHGFSRVLSKTRFLAPLARLVMSKDLADRLGEGIATVKEREKAFLSYAAAFSEKEKQELCLRVFGGGKIEEKMKPFFADGLPYASQLMRFDVETLLPDDYLMKVDKTTMAFGVEARVPFLDESVVAFGACMPARFKVNGFTTKYLYRKALKGVLPAEIIARKKHGFNVPTSAWLDGELGEIAAQLLSEERIAKRGYFKYGGVKNILKNYRRSESFYGRQFWALFALELWHSIYLDGEPRKPRGFEGVV